MITEKSPQETMAWFDPKNREHLKAYRYLQQHGYWPEGWPLGPLSAHWQVVIINMIADAYLAEKLDEDDEDVRGDVLDGPEVPEEVTEAICQFGNAVETWTLAYVDVNSGLKEWARAKEHRQERAAALEAAILRALRQTAQHKEG